MATYVLPYNVSHYNTLPELHYAKKLFDDNSANKALDQRIGRLFMNHKVHNTLGISLIHQHFMLEPTEHLVSFGPVALPLDLDVETDSPIRPLLYRFVDEGIAVYEWIEGEHAANVDLNNPKYQPFLKELRAVLEEDGLLDVLGVNVQQHLEGHGLEFTSGRANITLRLLEPPKDENDTSIRAGWTFDVVNGKVVKETKSWCLVGKTGKHSSQTQEAREEAKQISKEAAASAPPSEGDANTALEATCVQSHTYLFHPKCGKAPASKEAATPVPAPASAAPAEAEDEAIPIWQLACSVSCIQSHTSLNHTRTHSRK